MQRFQYENKIPNYLLYTSNQCPISYYATETHKIPKSNQVGMKFAGVLKKFIGEHCRLCPMYQIMCNNAHEARLVPNHYLGGEYIVTADNSLLNPGQKINFIDFYRGGIVALSGTHKEP